MGQGRKELCVRRTERQGDAGRPVRRPQPADRQSFHARARLEGRLHRLLVRRRQRRGRAAASGAARRGLCRVFARDESGNIFHTYSSYGRGAEENLVTYKLLDITPKGRDEGAGGNLMSW